MSYGDFFREHWARLLLAVGVLIFISYFSMYQLQRHRALETNIDLANMEQTIWNTLHGNFMRSTTFPAAAGRGRAMDFTLRKTESRLGTHVQPLFMFLALPYAAFPHSETLLLLMCVSVGLGAIPVFRLARRRFASSDVMGSIFALGYLLLPIVETNAGWDPHGLSFLPTFLLLALDAAESGKRGWWWLWALLAMSCREDAPFLTGWAMLWMAPQERRKDRIAMVGLGFFLSLLYFVVVIPFFGGSGSPFYSYFVPANVDLTWQSIVNLLSQPEFWASEIRNLLRYNLFVGLPVLFLYLLSWRSCLAMLPMLLLNGLSWYIPAQSPHLYHYAAPIVPWALVGAMDGFLLAERGLHRYRPRYNWRGVLGEGLLACIVATHLLQGYTPLNVNFDWPTATTRDAASIRALSEVPQDVAISADVNLAAHLSQRETLRFFRDIRDAEWVALDFWLGWDFYGGRQETWLDLAQSPAWETVAVGPGWIVLRQGEGPPGMLTELFSPPAETKMRPLDVRFGGEGRLHLTAVGLAQANTVLCSLWWSFDDENGVPWVRVSSSEGDVLYERSLHVARFAPQLMYSPSFNDCTNLNMTIPSDADIHFFVLDAQQQRCELQVISVGKWDISTNAQELILHVVE